MNFIAQEKLSLIYFFLTFDKNKMSLHDFVMYVCFRCVWVVHWENISKLLIRLKKVCWVKLMHSKLRSAGWQFLMSEFRIYLSVVSVVQPHSSSAIKSFSCYHKWTLGCRDRAEKRTLADALLAGAKTSLAHLLFALDVPTSLIECTKHKANTFTCNCSWNVGKLQRWPPLLFLYWFKAPPTVLPNSD